MKVAIVGATSHVAKALIQRFLAVGDVDLVLLARRPGAVVQYWGTELVHTRHGVHDISELAQVGARVDAIINCVGFGTPSKVRAAGIELFQVAEAVDKAITDLVLANPRIRYIDFSSGAVYGTSMSAPIEDGAISSLPVSPLLPVDSYRIAKIYQEAKHRTLAQLSIVDIRLFNFFSRHASIDDGYLMSDIVGALRSGKVLEVSGTEIFRDYISPADLFLMVQKLLEAPFKNTALDTYSAEPISKSDLLSKTERVFGLKYQVAGSQSSGATGIKPYYYSKNRLAETELGYLPTETSWQGIERELVALGFPPVGKF